jgi:hypothetical protein
MHLLATAQNEAEIHYRPWLFLLHLYRATGDDRFRSSAVRALEFDLAHATHSELGMQWPRFRGETVVYPYWLPPQYVVDVALPGPDF